jgi:hypothetical protein
MNKVGDIVKTIDGHEGEILRIDLVNGGSYNFLIKDGKTGCLTFFPERYIISKLRMQCSLELKNLIESEIV